MKVPTGTPIEIPKDPSPEYTRWHARDRETIGNADGSVNHLRSAGHNLGKGVSAIVLTPFLFIGGLARPSHILSNSVQSLRILFGGLKDLFFDPPAHAAM